MIRLKSRNTFSSQIVFFTVGLRSLVVYQLCAYFISAFYSPTVAIDTFKKIYGTSECIQELFFILYNLMMLAEKYAELL